MTVAAANHELGTVYPVGELAALARAGGALFYTDAVQAAGKIPFGVGKGHLDALTLSRAQAPRTEGGGGRLRAARARASIRRWRAATRSASGGPAPRTWSASSASARPAGWPGRICEESAARLAGLRDRLEERLLAIPGTRVHGRGRRVPGTLNVGFAGGRGALVLAGLDLEGIACRRARPAPREPGALAGAAGLGLGPDRAPRRRCRSSLGRPRRRRGNQYAAEVTAAWSRGCGRPLSRRGQ